MASVLRGDVRVAVWGWGAEELAHPGGELSEEGRTVKLRLEGGLRVGDVVEVKKILVEEEWALASRPGEDKVNFCGLCLCFRNRLSLCIRLCICLCLCLCIRLCICFFSFFFWNWALEFIRREEKEPSLSFSLSLYLFLSLFSLSNWALTSRLVPFFWLLE